MNKEEEGNNITNVQITKTESKMVPKSNENDVSQIKGFLPQISNHNFSRKSNYMAWKSKSGLQISVPLSDSSLTLRSREKNFKMGYNDQGKLLDFNGQNRSMIIIPVSQKPINSHCEEPGNLEKFIDIFKSTHHVGELKNEPLNYNPKKSEEEGFSQLLPFYKNELRKIKEIFQTTIYFSLSMRANLLQLIVRSFPDVDQCQFHTEDKRILKSFDRLKISTMAEEDNLLDLVKSILIAREKTKMEYEEITRSRTQITKKTAGEKQNMSQPTENTVTPAENEKLQDTEIPRKQQNLQLFLPENQNNTFSFSKQTEKTSKTNSTSNVEKKKKPGFHKLNIIQKEFEALKAKYTSENETYEKTIKDLENILEEKKRKLKQEKESKNQLLKLVTQLQAKQRRLGEIIGHEQMRYFVTQTPENQEIMRKELWQTTIRIILKGFFTQVKNLEVKRNKMLIHLRTYDMPVSNTSVTRKEFEALKAKYLSEIETYDIIMKDLEIPLKENKKISNCQKDVKDQLLKYVNKLQTQQKRLGDIITKEKLAFSIGELSDDPEEMRKELWLTSLRIILKEFFTRLKNLAMERNQILLHLRVNDKGNFYAETPSIIKKDFEALKAKFWAENKLYEKTIKELENLLNTKERIIKGEQEVNNQSKKCMNQIQTGRDQMGNVINSEKLKHFTKHPFDDREKRRKELRLTATRIILTGFSRQLENLETERDKMLNLLHTNDKESFNAKTASIIQKDNLVRNIKQQIMYFKTSYNEKINKKN